MTSSSELVTVEHRKQSTRTAQSRTGVADMVRGSPAGDLSLRTEELRRSSRDRPSVRPSLHRRQLESGPYRQWFRGRDCRYVERDVQLRHRPSRSQAFPGSRDRHRPWRITEWRASGFSAERSNSNALDGFGKRGAVQGTFFSRVFAPDHFSTQTTLQSHVSSVHSSSSMQGEMPVRWLIEIGR